MKNVFVTFLGTFLIQFLNIFSGIIIARILLPQGRGELTAIMLWPSLIATIGNFGIIEALSYYTAKNDLYHNKTLLSTCLIVITILSLILATSGYFILPFLLTEYSPTTLSIGRFYLILYIPLNFFTLSFAFTILGRLRLLEYNIVRVFLYVVNVIGLFILIILGKVSLSGIIWFAILANTSTLFLSMFIVISNGWLFWNPDIMVLKKLLTYGISAHLGSVANYLNSRLDQLLIAAFFIPSTLGIYVVAVTISGGVSLCSGTIAVVAFPQISNLQSLEEKEIAFGRYMRFTIYFSFLIALVLFVMTPWLLQVFFGNDYLQATWVARVLIIASVPLACNQIFDAGFKAYNNPIISSKAQVIGLVVTGLSLWLLLPRYQAIGAAYASLFAYLIVFVFMIFSVKTIIGIQPWHLFKINPGDCVYLKSKIQRIFGYRTVFKEGE